MTNARIIASFLKKAAVTTAKGATITLGSTVASCMLAMQIEATAHRVIYHYMPHKYANVDQAFGLTRQQLEAVRVREVPERCDADTTHHQTATPIIASALPQSSDDFMTSSRGLADSFSPLSAASATASPSYSSSSSPSSTLRFPDAPSAIVTYELRSRNTAQPPSYTTDLSEMNFDRHEIIACSMTG
uniref:Uncharacterized protein n=1 Tax=Craspedostauros australis TaxID=1486917 RepID=A0A7R9WSR5_9STRA|mmetsp:Transcript_19203/g.53347  ORF Transcript_19203/g.53347 Transcript_19203/m.53347 type:complete len:188 (+) Transcript_19203:175-738(+)|eukprot:CAMPEP_0198117094 /NCGR_PEP_ID=MMETSP1442-20131203/16418_1 /TAXON_ID= /ORGANISM="Craspedostauros australis, Strain CCMP3328" /LENGTH=187 /DNA_ID=CAMNT_0043775065 /DNA_START=140 /DNA_END=703 /DNA_ORIENTATION=+